MGNPILFRKSRPKAELPVLTPQMERSAKLIVQGFSDREIAVRLGLAVGTVKVLNSQMYKRVGTRRRAGFVSWFYRTFSAPKTAIAGSIDSLVGVFE